MAWNPAHRIVMLLGGEKAVSQSLGIARSAPYRWQYGRDRRGMGGCIPAKHIPKLIDMAKARGKRLGFKDFFEEPSEV